MMRLQLRKLELLRIVRTLTAAFLSLILICVIGMPRLAHSAEPTAPADWNPQLTTPGSLVICGGGILPWKLTERFIELGGGPEARVVLVTSASYYADHDIQSKLTNWYDRLCDNGIASFDILHTRSRDEANHPDFSKVLETATALWFLGGDQNWLSDTYVGTRTEERMHGILTRGGVIGGTSAGAAIMSRCMIAGGKTDPVLSTGLGFLPGTIVDQHFLKRNRQERLMKALELKPGHVGIGIDESTALVVRGRTIEVIGDSDALLCLASSVRRPKSMQTLAAGQQEDLVKLRRSAILRANSNVAAPRNQRPDVESGTLVIAGGGPTPQEVIESFLTAAGGMDSPIVVVSNAIGDDRPEESLVCGWLSTAGAKNVRLMHTTAEDDLHDPSLVSLLKEARGIWFTGGRQWRLVDAFLDTNIEELFHDVLRRGGVIGGTSAGATIQGEYLVRGNPTDNRVVSAEGYERGFGFLPGVAIDQHFTERDRLDDMTQLKKAHPELIGLGVDESTALIVRGSTMKVVGQRNVTVFDRQANAEPDSAEFAVLKSGECYDLRQHRRMDVSEAASVSTK